MSYFAKNAFHSPCARPLFIHLFLSSIHTQPYFDQILFSLFFLITHVPTKHRFSFIKRLAKNSLLSGLNEILIILEFITDFFVYFLFRSLTE